MERHIYTLVRRTDWAAAEEARAYTGSEDDRRDGFLHFSTAGQLRATAAKHRAGEADLVIVEADAAAGEAVGEAVGHSSRRTTWLPASQMCMPHLPPGAVRPRGALR